MVKHISSDNLIQRIQIRIQVKELDSEYHSVVLTFMHFGQSVISQALSGHIWVQSGLYIHILKYIYYITINFLLFFKIILEIIAFYMS